MIINEKNIRVEEIEMPLLNTTIEFIEQYYKLNFNQEFMDDIIDITNMDIPNKIAILDIIIDKETLIIPSIFSEEEFHRIANSRELHNEYFAQINAIYRIMDFKNKKGNLTPENKFNLLKRMLSLTKAYKAQMEKLFDDAYNLQATIGSGEEQSKHKL